MEIRRADSVLASVLNQFANLPNPWAMGLSAGTMCQTVQEKIEPIGFDFGDTIVGTTDPAHPEQPFQIKELPLNPNWDRSLDDHARDPFEFRRRLKQLAGKPMVVQVIRDKDKSGKTVNVLVPPAYHWTLGVCMEMGEVAAIRKDSPAEKAGMQLASASVSRSDKLKRMVVVYDETRSVEIPMDDPTRLPFELARAARNRPVSGKPVKVRVTVLRPNQNNHKAEEDHELLMDWDDHWDAQEEGPASISSPLSIPQLGIAYRIQTTVVRVARGSSDLASALGQLVSLQNLCSLSWSAQMLGKTQGSPAESEGIKKYDEFLSVAVRKAGLKIGEGKWSKFIPLKDQRGPDGKEVYRWAHFFYALQEEDYHEFKLEVKRDKETREVILKAVPDTTWPLEERGLLLQPDRRLQKADSVGQALTYGVDQTWSFLKQMYLNLRSLFTGRVSVDTLGGPIELARQTFAAAENMYTLVLFLGMISLNLAVVNFLPIPVLDGGHMVFLLYEKLRGRPPSETVRMVATYVGLILILGLMLFVFWLDLGRLELWSWLKSKWQ